MVHIRINRSAREIQSAPDTPLLWVLRCEARLTGTKFGCGIGVCGACSVLIDNQIEKACTTPLSIVREKSVVTIEGLDGPVADALRQAWLDFDVVQCGYCQSAQIIAAWALLNDHPQPNDADIDDAMEHITCRCGTFPRIRLAIHHAAQTLKGKS